MRLRKSNAVKEAFDNLPSGVCFFDGNGIVTLCNYQMHRLIFALTGRDLQSLPEIEALLDGTAPANRVDKDIFLLGDGSVWRFARERVTTRDGIDYTQVTAADVTELYHRQNELKEDNKRLEEYAERMRRLSANIITLIREEETLNMKMRVHDDIGRSVIATRRLLQQHRPTSELDLTAWKNAVRLLKHDTDRIEDNDALARLMTAAGGIGIRIVLDGELPANTAAADLLITAMRECMTNAVRHAGASELYVQLCCNDSTASAVISNNGAVPEGKITEGGGLSSLRARIYKSGGTMTLQSLPEFRLTVSVPLRPEETI